MIELTEVTTMITFTAITAITAISTITVVAARALASITTDVAADVVVEDAVASVVDLVSSNTNRGIRRESKML